LGNQEEAEFERSSIVPLNIQMKEIGNSVYLQQKITQEVLEKFLYATQDQTSSEMEELPYLVYNCAKQIEDTI